MKKFIYSLALVALSFAAFTSCTEEEVKPQTEQDGSKGGNPIKE
jgi:hypothetical protein